VTPRPAALVLDTSALLRFTLDAATLSSKAQRAITEALATNACYLSSISLWEIALKVRQEKLRIGLTVDEFARRVEQIAGLTVLPVDATTWLRNVQLDWAHRDPADRTIVATAMLRKASIATTDRTIAAFFSDTIP
jgi:PIN domain nuclease of toxin-antitoxin system